MSSYETAVAGWRPRWYAHHYNRPELYRLAGALAWLPRVSPRAVRRLQLAAEQGRALGVLYRSQRFANEASPAMLRLLLEPLAGGRHGARISLIKSRGGSREPIHLEWAAAPA